MKSICIILISVFLFHLGFAQNKATTMLFPYLSASKKIGYCNSECQLIIASKSDYAGPLESWHVVVGKNTIITLPLYNRITVDCYVAKTENG